MLYKDGMSLLEYSKVQLSISWIFLFLWNGIDSVDRDERN